MRYRQNGVTKYVIFSIISLIWGHVESWSYTARPLARDVYLYGVEGQTMGAHTDTHYLECPGCNHVWATRRIFRDRLINGQLAPRRCPKCKEQIGVPASAESIRATQEASR
jgi:hypothetical protein